MQTVTVCSYEQAWLPLVVIVTNIQEMNLITAWACIGKCDQKEDEILIFLKQLMYVSQVKHTSAAKRWFQPILAPK